MVIHTVERNEADIQALNLAEAKFYELCVQDKEPVITTSDPATGETFNMEPDVERLVGQYLDLNKQKKELESEIEVIKNGIAALVGDNNKQVGDRYSAHYQYIETKTTDWKAIVKDYGVQVGNYKKESGYYKLTCKEVK